MTTFIRVPEYFPRILTMACIRAADRVILADTFAYSRQAFMNRTRIRTPEGWRWLTVPLHHGQGGVPLIHVRIADDGRWRRRHWRAVLYNYRSAPYFEHYAEPIEAFFRQSWTSLGLLTVASIRLLLRLLAWEVHLEVASSCYPEARDLRTLVRQADVRELLSLPESLEHDAYVLPARTLPFSHPEYRQCFAGFESGMSMLDLLFNYGPDATYLIDRALTQPEMTVSRKASSS